MVLSAGQGGREDLCGSTCPTRYGFPLLIVQLANVCCVFVLAASMSLDTNDASTRSAAAFVLLSRSAWLANLTGQKRARVGPSTASHCQPSEQKNNKNWLI